MCLSQKGVVVGGVIAFSCKADGAFLPLRVDVIDAHQALVDKAQPVFFSDLHEKFMGLQGLHPKAALEKVPFGLGALGVKPANSVLQASKVMIHGSGYLISYL